MSADNNQLGFAALLRDAEDTNRARASARASAHLPATMEEGIPYYRHLLGQHHAAMLAANIDETMHLRSEADLLAVKLNGGDRGIFADNRSSGFVLEQETAAAAGCVPLWGQCGSFIIEVAGMRVCAVLSSMIGIATGFLFWPGFEAHAVDYDKPFLSPTGYRSFIGVPATPAPNQLPDEFVRQIVAGHVARDLKGSLVAIDERYRKDSA